MGLEEELLRIAKKLEKMVARKKTVRLQSLQRSPRATEARLGQPLAWWACRPCARRERTGHGTARQGSPPATCWPLRVGMCLPRSEGHRPGSPQGAWLLQVSVDGSGALLGRAEKAQGETQTRGRTFRSPGGSGCAQGPGSCRPCEKWRDTFWVTSKKIGEPRAEKGAPSRVYTPQGVELQDPSAGL